MPRKLTVAELLDGKGKITRSQIFTKDPDEAAAAEAAGIDMIITPLPTAKTIRAAAPDTFLTVGMVGDHAASTESAVKAAFEGLFAGGDAVYTSAGYDKIRAMRDEWIPVVGHVGFVPYRLTWFGKRRAVGKTAAEARKVYDAVKAYENAGAIGVEMEVVPQQVAAEIAKRTTILIISMGAGPSDVQYLFACDILGTHDQHYPRHAKTYRDLRPQLKALQEERIAGLREYHNEVHNGNFPEKQHIVDANPDELKAFIAALETD